MAADREKALEAGCDDYDTKPIELPRLLEKIEPPAAAAGDGATVAPERPAAARPGDGRGSRAGGPGSPIIRQELLTPVGAIVGYQEILGEEAQAARPDDAAPDLEQCSERRRGSARLVDRLLDRAAGAIGAGRRAAARLEAKLRHDLRTPLNAIIGYSEMLLEDSRRRHAERAAARPREAAGRGAPAAGERIDAIVDLSPGRRTPADATDAAALDGGGACSGRIRPVGRAAERRLEVGPHPGRRRQRQQPRPARAAA